MVLRISAYNWHQDVVLLYLLLPIIYMWIEYLFMIDCWKFYAISASKGIFQAMYYWPYINVVGDCCLRGREEQILSPMIIWEKVQQLPLKS